ncbi:hypothetical protein SeLEV6574_g04310 [Synchytrium endobioticum]|uniref:Uncharacterized protein n=1 Tax=Synchytrium endobioticum TaxID=286115 RepID=A0A507D0D7_9FUNG|nr:hypothetical protein SeLEV6574_g04310 [Synchytrium endobioticum]
MASAMATDELNDLVRDDDADLFAPSSEDRRNEVHQPRPIHYYTARIDDHHLVHAPPDSDWMDDDDDLLFNGNDLCNFDPKAPPHLSDDEGGYQLIFGQHQHLLLSELEEKDGASPLLASLHSHSHGDYFPSQADPDEIEAPSARAVDQSVGISLSPGGNPPDNGHVGHIEIRNNGPSDTVLWIGTRVALLTIGLLWLIDSLSVGETLLSIYISNLAFLRIARPGTFGTEYG